jgi:hypothetical protein
MRNATSALYVIPESVPSLRAGSVLSVLVPLGVTQSSKHQRCTYVYFLVMSLIKFFADVELIRQYIIPWDKYKNGFC